MNMKKSDWLRELREYAKKETDILVREEPDNKERVKIITKQINAYREKLISGIVKSGTDEATLDSILLVTYSSYVVMLECRNMFWEYEYMAFSRRIGELWEPFCKLAFKYSLKPLTIVEPPDFSVVQNDLRTIAVNYVKKLNISEDKKEEMLAYYNVPWGMIESGGIKLSLDLHFKSGDVTYNCDFKSGFSSNEKGNTNRLLLVASIYKMVDSSQKSIIFVRQEEDQNNHYLQILKNSEFWDVYCSSDAYEAIHSFTGKDLRKWLDENADWENDISKSFLQHLKTNDLLKYLKW